LLYELQIDLQDLLESSILKEVLLYHVVSGRFTADELKKGDLETVNGQKVDVVRRGVKSNGFEVDGLRLRDAQNRKIDVVVGNLEAENGVVHVVDQVLVPEFENIVQIATEFDDFSILVEALTKADLVETLINEGPFTVFAPNNDAFYKLSDQLGLSLNEILELDILKDVLLYHVLNGSKSTKDFEERDYEMLNGQTTRWDTEHDRKDRGRRYTDGFAVEGYGVVDQQGDRKHVIIGNLRAHNGIVHVIDGVLLPRD